MTTISKSCVRQNTWQIKRPCYGQETWRLHEVCQYISFTKPEAETATKPTQMLFNEVADIGEFKDFQGPVEWNSSTFKHLSCFSSTFKALNLAEKIQVLSRTFKDVREPWFYGRQLCEQAVASILPRNATYSDERWQLTRILIDRMIVWVTEWMK